MFLIHMIDNTMNKSTPRLGKLYSPRRISYHDHTPFSFRPAPLTHPSVHPDFLVALGGKEEFFDFVAVEDLTSWVALEEMYFSV